MATSEPGCPTSCTMGVTRPRRIPLPSPNARENRLQVLQALGAACAIAVVAQAASPGAARAAVDREPAVAIVTRTEPGDSLDGTRPYVDLPDFLPKIDRRPSPADFGRGVLSALPAYDPKSQRQWQVDLRGYDLSGLELRTATADLMFADFDSKTKWPPSDRMPRDYDWTRIMDLGKDPGLGVRQLHAQGVTGRGVGIAIVDQPLIVDHSEYADQLRLYEEINVAPETGSQMHGAAVASIAVGKTTGVAPEADLYYIGSWTGDWGVGPNRFTDNFIYYAEAIRRILQIDALLPANRKIRVISLQIGWAPEQKGYKEITAAVSDAKAAGLLVVSSSLEETFGWRFHGLGRQPLKDPNRAVSYEPGLFWSSRYYSNDPRAKDSFANRLLIPMDSRTTAGPCGPDDYVFYRQGGWSWAIPYIAGLYALAVQVKPTTTPDEFWNTALATAKDINLAHDGTVFRFGRIVDPPALIARLQGP